MKDLPLMCTCVRELFTYIEIGGGVLFKEKQCGNKNPQSI